MVDPFFIGVIILFIFLIGVVFLYERGWNSAPKMGKPAAVKKEEIIAGYQEEMSALLETYKEDRERYLQEKKKILLRINRELATNIFFDPEEVRTVLSHLARP